MKAALIIFSMLLGCGPKHKPAEPVPSDGTRLLQTRMSAWFDELKKAADERSGWPTASDCDQTLWAGEARAGGATINLGLAEYASGEIHRRPAVEGECYPKDSSTSVSRDMLVGYMLGSWAAKDKGALERLAAYGEANHWVMGLPFPGDFRVILEPGGQGILGRAVAKLGGDKRPYASIPQVCLPVGKDYERHIQTLAILLDGMVSGGVTSLCLDRLKDNATNNPGDALFQAALATYSGGDQSPALSLLNDDTYQCPSYVRPAAAYCLVHKIFAARVVLGGD